MAKKPVKKVAVKKAPAKKVVAKKAPAKKTTKATVKPVVAAPAPEVKAIEMNTCSAGCGCGCKRGGFGRFLGKLIIFLVIFALGFATAKFCCMKHGMHRGDFGPRPEFVNGCMDLSSVKCPEMAERITLADVNADGCITEDEFKSFKDKMRLEMRDGRRPSGPRGERPERS